VNTASSKWSAAADTVKAEQAIIAIADKETSQTLVGSLHQADDIRTGLMDDWHANVPEIQDLNMTCAAITAVLVYRHPEIDDAIDDWCEAIDCDDDRTMARFIVDFVMDNAEVIA
tara:strand:+ start:483 stop:827 length:345 start_codon:yes stop_codon:yes gene_type:complete